MAVEALTTSRDQRLYLSRRADAFVVGELDGRVELCRFPRTAVGATVLLHPDSRRLVTDTTQGSIDVFEIRTGRVLRRFESAERLLGLDREGARFFCSDADGLVVRELETGATVLANPPKLEQLARVDAIGDEWLLLSSVPGSFVARLVAVNLKTGQSHLLQADGGAMGVWPLPDQRRAVVLEGQGRVRLWDVPSGEALRTLQAGPRLERSELDGAGKKFSSFGVDGTAREVAVGDERTAIEVSLGLLAPSAFLLDANRRAVVTVSGPDSVSAWSFKTAGAVQRWQVPGVRRLLKVGARWFAGTSTALLLLEGDSPRQLWEGASAPTAAVEVPGRRMLVGTEDDAVHFAAA